VDEHRGTVPDVPIEDVVRKMADARDLGVRAVIFSGGEPTIRGDLIRLARAARGLGLGFGLITNGRRLAYPAYREALLDLGLSYVHTSLHGASRETHDLLVRCAGFDNVIDALHGLSGTDVELHVNTVITRTNVGELNAISDILAKLAPITHKLCLMEPRGLFESHEDELSIPPEDAGKAAVSTLQQSGKQHAGSGLVTVIEGFPLCQIDGVSDAISGLHAHNIMYMSEGFEHGLFPTDQGERTFPEECGGCAARTRCPGVYVGYADRYGDHGLAPVK